MTNDPILTAAVKLKNEIASVGSPELDAEMAEIMKLLLSCTEGDKEN